MSDKSVLERLKKMRDRCVPPEMYRDPSFEPFQEAIADLASLAEEMRRDGDEAGAPPNDNPDLAATLHTYADRIGRRSGH